VNQPVSLTALLTPSSATGTVHFYNGAALLGSAGVSGGTATLNLPGFAVGTYSLTAQYGGDSSHSAATSPAVNFAVKTTSSIVVTSSLNPSLSGQSVTFTAAVTPASATGTVQFLDGGAQIGAATIASGTASFSTSSLASGQHSITASYGGDANNTSAVSAALTQTVNPLTTTTTTLQSSQNPLLAGGSVTFTASVSPSTATGTVQFLNGGAVIGAGTLSAGTTSFSTSALSVGTYAMTAAYSGDTANAASTSAVLSQAVRISAGLAMTITPSTVVAGQTVTITATMNAAATGSVKITDGSTALATVPVTAGTASYSGSFTQGLHMITAAYSGDGTYMNSSSGINETVLAASAVVVTTSLNPSTQGQSVTFAATVTPSTATGTVQFLDGGAVIGTASLVSGVASFSTAALAAGTHSITAAYGGDASDSTASSTPLSQTVKIAAGAAVASSLNPAITGQTVTITATVTPSTATGTVQFLDGATVLGTAAVSSGTAVLTTSALAQGAHVLTVAYSGDANDASAVSSAITQTVNPKNPTTTALSSNLNPAPVGNSVGFTATVSAGATGSVQFFDGATLLGSGSIVGTTVSLTTSTLTQGTHSITAVYGGDSINAPSTSAVLTEIVKLNAGLNILTSLDPSVVGQTVTFTATLNAAATGTVQFLDGSTVLGTATASGGSAAFSTSTLTQGSHSMSANYSGDSNYASHVSVGITQTVNAKATTATTVTSPQNPAIVGAAVTFTAAVSPSTATGTVQFLDGATVLGTGTLAGGAASFNISTLAVGAHAITAVYGGDAVNAGSTSAVLSQVMKLSAGLTTGVSPSPAVAGQTVKITAAMNSAATGTVQFTDGGAVLATVAVAAGTASFSTSTLSQGSHTLGVVYSGDGTYMSASATFPETVLAASTVVVASSVNPSAVGQSVTFTASVTPSTATGSVQFYDGGTSIGAASLASGIASFSTASLAKGTHSISAAYGGDAADAAAASATLSQIVKAAASVSLTSSVNPSTVGQAVTFSASVTPSAATGTIQFLNGSTVLGTVSVSSGSAAFSISSLAAGAHSITASYSGDAYDTAATSTALTQTVNVAAPAAPSSLTATASGSSQINLAWHTSATSGVTYNVYGSTSAGFTPSASNRLATGVAATSYDATGLSASTTYYFRVTAVNAGGESAATNQANATTAGLFACHVSYSVTTQ
jgi:large repetitive protein